MTHPNAEQIARAFHETYEELAPRFGYRTREESAKPWAEVPLANRGLMVATVTRLIEGGFILPALEAPAVTRAATDPVSPAEDEAFEEMRRRAAVSVAPAREPGVGEAEYNDRKARLESARLEARKASADTDRAVALKRATAVWGNDAA